MAETCVSRYIKGNAVIIEFQDETGEWKKVAAQRGGTLNRTAETLDVSNKEGFGWNDSEAGNKEWSIDCDGLIVDGDEALDILDTIWENGECLRVRVRFPSGKVKVGTAIITDFPHEFSYDDAATYSMTLQGKGPLETDQTAPIVLPRKVVINEQDAQVTVGQTTTLTTTFTPENVTDKSVTWASLTPTLATVDEKGVVTGVKAGEATIQVRSTVNTSVSATATVTVKEA